MTIVSIGLNKHIMDFILILYWVEYNRCWNGLIIDKERSWRIKMNYRAWGDF